MLQYPDLIVIQSPAKINLTLDVMAKRSDGYHDIRSVMQPIKLYDTLTVRRMPNQPGISLDVMGPHAQSIPADETNLVYQAALCLVTFAANNRADRKVDDGIHLTLQKEIPSQAGLGGGSSNAAATLRAVSRLLNLAPTHYDMLKMASSLGADVPFFLNDGLALVEGLGERVTTLGHLIPTMPLVIVKPPVGISTGWAYQSLDLDAKRIMLDSTSRWLTGSTESRLHLLHNDFHDLVCASTPAVAAVVSLLSIDNGKGGMFRPILCGSGSSVFCFAATKEIAEEMAGRVRTANAGDVWTTQTIV